MRQKATLEIEAFHKEEEQRFKSLQKEIANLSQLRQTSAKEFQTLLIEYQNKFEEFTNPLETDEMRKSWEDLPTYKSIESIDESMLDINDVLDETLGEDLDIVEVDSEVPITEQETQETDDSQNYLGISMPPKLLEKLEKEASQKPTQAQSVNSDD